jgi:hypothetical protein
MHHDIHTNSTENNKMPSLRSLPERLGRNRMGNVSLSFSFSRQFSFSMRSMSARAVLTAFIAFVFLSSAAAKAGKDGMRYGNRADQHPPAGEYFSF